LDLGGGTSKNHIEYGIEQYEDFKEDMAKSIAIGSIQNSKAGEGYRAGMSAGKKVNDLVLRLPRSFG